MDIRQKQQQLENLILKLNLKTNLPNVKPNKGERYPISRVGKNIDTLWVVIQKKKYIVIMRGDKNTGISKIIHDFIGRDYDRTDGQNNIWDFDTFDEIQNIIYKYAGVEKENMDKIFAWVQWFNELAKNISKKDQDTFANLVKQVVKDENQSIIRFKAYDPFSFIYYLAQKNTTHQRKLFFTNATNVFDIKAPLPDFDNNNCWIFPTPPPHSNVLYKWNEKYEPDLLWDFFQQIISIKNIDELTIKTMNEEFIDDFKEVLSLTSVGVPKLTQTLFLMNPNVFFTIDRILKPISNKLLDNSDSDTEKNIGQLTNNVKKNGLTDYLEIMQKICALFPNQKPYEINYHLWENQKIEVQTMSEQLKQTTDLLTHKKQIILQGSPGTGKTRLAIEIAYYLVRNEVLSDDKNERQEQLKTLTQPNQVIQENINETAINFSDYLQNNQIIPTIGGRSKFTITAITQNNIGIELNSGRPHNVSTKNILNRIYEQDWTTRNGLSPYEAGIAKYIFNSLNGEIVISERKPLNLEQYKLIQFHPAYSYEDFVRGIVAETGTDGISYTVQNKVLAEMAENAFNNPDKPFVLIIDEINRANLPAVLGELIYALEYRDEAVESMYEYQGSREIILPENLYIIGTMNTADRSVGHIDYAIRRRFAFVSVPTERKVIEDNKPNNLKLFDKVKSLFGNHLNKEEFELNDVMIGHSYFLKDNLEQALEYEIKPILLEYLKDGVLLCDKSDITILDVN